jgi:plastocyanin
LKVSTTPKFASPSASAPVHSGVVQIAYRNIAIDPDTLKVKVDSTIRWTNYDSIEHNVTSEGVPMHFASKNFGEGQTFTVKLTTPGVIHYECTIHPTTMNGTIDVVKLAVHAPNDALDDQRQRRDTVAGVREACVPRRP